VEYGQPAHDELLFVIVHQAYELWFKQVLHEIDSVLALFRADSVDERSIGVALARLARVTEIQKLLVDQLRVLETMTPLDFLDFRDFLLPASGFQSLQFRLIENKLGLRPEQRAPTEKSMGGAALTAEAREALRASESEPSLFAVVERWLERTPFLETPGSSSGPATAGRGRHARPDREAIARTHSRRRRQRVQLAELDRTAASFAAVLDEGAHARLVAAGQPPPGERPRPRSSFTSIATSRSSTSPSVSHHLVDVWTSSRRRGATATPSWCIG
jgi:tryptophan 2,3-dioxygenase